MLMEHATTSHSNWRNRLPYHFSSGTQLRSTAKHALINLCAGFLPLFTNNGLGQWCMRVANVIVDEPDELILKQYNYFGAIM